LVANERGLVFGQFHFGDAIVELFAFLFDFRELVFGLLFVVDVDFGEALTGFDESTKHVNVFALFPVILSGVKGFACESLRGVERPRVCWRCQPPYRGVLIRNAVGRTSDRELLSRALLCAGGRGVPRLRMTVL
jgi:hypothetical protein